MKNLENNPNSENEFINNQKINLYLLETVKWEKFLAILGYVGIGVFLLVGIFSLSFFYDLYKGVMPMNALVAGYFIIAAAYFFPVNYLYQFSTRIKEGIRSNSTESLEMGFKNLKSLFKFMGVFSAVVISIYALIFIIAISFGLLAGISSL